MIGNLNSMIATEFKSKLKSDPDMAEEFESKSDIQAWIKSSLSDDISGIESKSLRAFLKRNIDIKSIMREI